MCASHRRWLPTAYRFVLLCAFVLCIGAGAALAQADSTTANLSGFVRDPAGAVVPGATVTARNAEKNVVRTATSNDEGFYQLVRLPPGTYEVSVEATNFKKAVVPSVTVTVGQRADLDIALEVGQITDVVTVTGAQTELVETSKTNVSNTIDQTRINNLPINQRDYINFTLTTSTVTRDNGRPIGPAPTSGLNFGGQRGRSNLVQVDGADNTDNSVNAARSTVSQAAVQEFQVVTNALAPEFGRTAGGGVNVVTKSGTNDVRGDIFGFIRHKSIQSRNPFAPIIDNDPSKKPGFTRAQYGASLGFPLDKDRTFGFLAFEQRRRQESGFFTSDVVGPLTGSVTIGAPFLPFSQTYTRVTPAQATYVQTLLTSAGQLIASGVPGNIALGQALASAAIQYATLASSGGQTGLNGSSTLVNPGGSIPAGQVIGPRFFPTGAPVPVNQNAFRPLLGLARVFPIKEATTFNSARLDHKITDRHNLAMRFGYNPSDITGIQVESQNQALGQNDFSRTGRQTLRDSTFVTTLTSTLSNTLVNEARFNFGQRRATFTSQNGQGTAYNISGIAFIGRELFSPVVRTENRYQYTDNVSWVAGNHTMKFGGDANFISVSADFELNFAGLFNFGGLSATTLAAFPTVGGVAAPDFTSVQQYGIGFPGNFIQGFGNPHSALKNRPLAWFAQDSWKIRHNITLNYGVRYDIELTDQIAPVDFVDPLSGLAVPAANTLAFYNAFHIQQGFPRDKNNFAPRIGMAWDLQGNGKTLLRAAYGLFYDHPLLAIGFNSDIADNVQQQQFIALPGNPAPNQLLNAVQIFQGTVCTAAGGNPLCPPGVLTPGAAAPAQYQFGRQRYNDQTFSGFDPFLPFSPPVSSEFEFAYANQANVTVERKLSENMSLSASWLFTVAHHLPHPTNLNAPNNALLIQNFVRCFGTQPSTTTSVLTVSPSACSNIVAQPIPGLVAVTTRGTVVQPFAANLVRPSLPNYFFVQAITGGAATPATPATWRGEGGWRSFFADFIVAPIFEMSSGRPFNILTGQDTNNDLTSNTDRPSVDASGRLSLPAPFQSGTLGRNMGLTHTYQSLDLRVARTVPLGERFKLEVIAEGFNLFNRFNEAA